MSNIILEKRKKLNTIHEIIEISKFNIMSELQDTYKQLESNFVLSHLSMNVMNFIENKYWVKSKVNLMKANKSNIFVFLTFESKNFLKTSYDKHKEIIEREFVPGKDKIVAIGKEAIEFAKDREYEVTFSTENYNENIGNELGSILNGLYLNHEVNKINFVCLSPQVKDKSVTIIPFKEMNIDYAQKEEYEEYGLFNLSSSHKFFPSVLNVISSLSFSYIIQITNALFLESKIYHIKSQIAKHDESMKNIESEINKLQRDLRKEKVAKETRDILFNSQIIKHNRKDGEK